MAVFGNKGDWMLNFCFLTPKRQILARNHVVWRIYEKSVQVRGLWAVGRTRKKKPSMSCLMRNFRHTGKRNPLRDRDKILHVGRYSGPNQVYNIWWRSVKRFGRDKGSNFPFPHWLASSLLQHSRTTVRVCNYWQGWPSRDAVSRDRKPDGWYSYTTV